MTVNKVASKTHTEKIPYSKIKKLTSKTYSLAKIAAVIVSIYAAEGITLPYAIPIIVELLKDVTGAVDGVSNGSSKHGLVIKRTYGKFYTFKDNVAIEHTGWHVTYIGKY